MRWLISKFGRSQISRARANADEELLYAQVAQEVMENDIRPGLWAKAVAASEGDERKVKARYLGLRVEQLIIQKTAAQVAKRELESNLAKIAKLEGPPTPETHVRCPDCRNFIRREASKCRHCGCRLVPQ